MLIKKYPKLQVLKEAFKALFSKRYTTKYPFKPHKAAGGFRGKPVPDNEICIGCDACSEICPAQAIVIEDKTVVAKRIISWLYDRCIYCGQCEDKCPQSSPGVVMTGEYDFADYTVDKMKSVLEFELVVCGRCRNPVGTKKQLLAAAKRIGPALASSNPNMILARRDELGFTQPTINKRKEVTRQDIFTYLCPACRHDVYRAEANK
jgi:hydrogenase-4 component H